MTYRKKIALFFIGYSLFLSFIYSSLIIGSLFITEDRLYERFLSDYAVKAVSAMNAGNVQSPPLINSNVYSNDNIPDQLKDLPAGIIELNDTHILVKPLENNRSLFLSMPEINNMIDQIVPYAISALIVIGVGISLLGTMLAVMLAYQLSRPIEQLVADVRKASIDSSNIYHEGTTELSVLAQSFNQAMLRISLALEREKSFTQSVSHELRTPLMVIKTNLAILREHDKPLEVMERITERMQRATRNMVTLTNTFLTLARQDNSVLEKSSFNPATMIERLIQTRGDEQTVDWSVECAKETQIEAPVEVFEILLTNIIDNGNKYAANSASIRVTDNYLETSNTTQTQDVTKVSSKLGISIIERICDALDWQVSHSISHAKFTLTIEFNKQTPLV